MIAERDREQSRDPAFISLLRRRQRVRFAVAGLLVGLYLVFALVALYRPQWFSTPVAAGSVVGWGLPLAYLIIAVSIVACGAYVHWANVRFEAEERRLGRGSEPEPPA